jgi:lactoylglutathione lyase
MRAHWLGGRRGVSNVSDVTEFRIALTVSDFNAAVAFYRDALGLEQLADWSTDDGRVVVLSAGRATLELFDQAQAEFIDQLEVGRRVSGPVRFAFEVTDSDATARRLIAGGGEEMAAAKLTPWGDRNARVQAPDGMQLTLFTPPAESP